MPFIAIGPGRCGTHSVKWIFDSCRNVSVGHESFSPVWGKPETVRPLAEHLSDDSEIRGESSYRIVGHVDALRSHIPELPVICLRRESKAVIDSWIRNSPTGKSPFVKEHRPSVAHCHPTAFPVMHDTDLREAIRRWVVLCEDLMEAVDGPVLHIHPRELNGDLTRIMDFIGIPEEGRTPNQQRLWNWTCGHKP